MENANNKGFRLVICRRGTMNPEARRSASHDSVEVLLQAAASWIAKHAAEGEFYFYVEPSNQEALGF